MGKTLCMAFLLKEKCFRSAPDGVLMAHAKVAADTQLAGTAANKCTK